MLRFGETKSETLNLRVSPSFKRALKVVAERENRSMVNALECLVIEYFEKKGLTEADMAEAAQKAMSEGTHAGRQ